MYDQLSMLNAHDINMHALLLCDFVNAEMYAADRVFARQSLIE